MSSLIRRLQCAMSFAFAILLVTACGPRAQDSASPLRAVPGDLTAPTSTSTTTTTSLPPSPASTVASEAVLLHFILGDSITTVLRTLPVGPEPQDVLDSLLDGFPTSSFGTDVRSAIPRDLEATVSV
jgi:hypothetical protein